MYIVPAHPIVLSIGRHTASGFHGHTTPEDAGELLDRIVAAGVLDTLDDTARILGHPRVWTAVEDDSTAWVQIYAGAGEAQADRLWTAIVTALGDTDLDGMDISLTPHSVGETIPALIATAIALTTPETGAPIRWAAAASHSSLGAALGTDRIRLGRIAPHTRVDALRLWAALWAVEGRAIPLSGQRLPMESWGGGQADLPALTPVGEWVDTYGRQLHGWAAHTGGALRTLVIDLDRGHADGVDGVQSWETWCDEHLIDLPDTLMVSTPSGGQHIYMTVPHGIALPRSISGLAPGVDIRCHGGLVVGPGSRRGDGGRYTIAHRAPIAEAPIELLDSLPTSGVGGEIPESQRKDEKPARRSPSMRPSSSAWQRTSLDRVLDDRIAEMLDVDSPRGRNDRLISAAGAVLNVGGTGAHLRALRLAAEAAGLEADEIEKVLRSALGYAEVDNPDFDTEEAIELAMDEA